jgi:hypothetical protein
LRPGLFVAGSAPGLRWDRLFFDVIFNRFGVKKDSPRSNFHKPDFPL